MFNRRKYLQGTVLAGTAVALAACGLDEGGGDGGDGSEGGGEGGAVPFTIYTARDSELAEKVVEDFEAAHPEWEGMATILTLGAQEALERVRAESSNPGRHLVGRHPPAALPGRCRRGARPRAPGGHRRHPRGLPRP